MAKVEPLRSNRSIACFSVFFASMVLWGCARSAPTLPTVQNDPPIVTTNEAKSESTSLIECEKLHYRLEALEEEESALNAIIQGDRGKNQVAGYLGIFLLVPYLATEGHVGEKRRLDLIQVERDGVYAEMKEHQCPSLPR